MRTTVHREFLKYKWSFARGREKCCWQIGLSQRWGRSKVPIAKTTNKTILLLSYWSLSFKLQSLYWSSYFFIQAPEKYIYSSYSSSYSVEYCWWQLYWEIGLDSPRQGTIILQIFFWVHWKLLRCCCFSYREEEICCWWSQDLHCPETGKDFNVF